MVDLAYRERQGGSVRINFLGVPCHRTVPHGGSVRSQFSGVPCRGAMPQGGFVRGSSLGVCAVGYAAGLRAAIFWGSVPQGNVAGRLGESQFSGGRWRGALLQSSLCEAGLCHGGLARASLLAQESRTHATHRLHWHLLFAGVLPHVSVYHHKYPLCAIYTESALFVLKGGSWEPGTSFGAICQRSSPGLSAVHILAYVSRCDFYLQKPCSRLSSQRGPHYGATQSID